MENKKLNLTTEEINIILNALACRPYGEVYSLIDKIMKQCEVRKNEQQSVC